MVAEVLPLRTSPVFEFVGRSSARGVVWAWAQLDLDMASAPAARAELTGLVTDLDAPDRMLVYLGLERFVDLYGLRVLADATARLQGRGGRLVVVRPPWSLRTMIDLTGEGAALALASTARLATRRSRRQPACRPAGGSR